MENNLIKKEIKVQEKLIGILKVGNINYISLTDLARYANPDDPSGVIRNWMSNKNSFDYYSLWEEINNENFNSVESHRIKINEVGYNRFTMTPNRWEKDFNAIGIIPSRGKYSKGTYAHPDIAFEFASWLSPEFKLYLIKEFERLKQQEAKENNIEWSIRRSISKTNYKLHTESIRDNIIPYINDNQKHYIYADEADVINVALFGMTAREWKTKNKNKKGNIRDNTDILHLIILSNLEVLNSEMIDKGISQSKRLEQLNKSAIKQLTILYDNNNILKIENTIENHTIENH